MSGSRKVVPQTVAGAALLMGVIATGVAVSLRWAGDDPMRRMAVMVAATSAGCGSLVGWLVARWGRGRGAPTAVGAGLGAVLLRIAPPLAVLAWLGGPGRELRDAGAAGLLVSFYLALLTVDIVLHVAAGPDRPRATDRDTVN